MKQLFITQKNDDITAYYATIAARFMGWGAVLNEYYAKTEYHLFSALSRPAAGIKFAPFYKKRGLIPVAASFDSKMREFMQYGVPSGMIRSNDNQIFARKKLSGPMKKNNRKHVIIVVLFFSLIIAAYFLSALFLDDNMPRPRYERYDQSNRLDKIRKGLSK